MRSGDTAIFAWNVLVRCGAIELQGMMLTLHLPDGTSRSEAVPTPMPIVMLTGQKSPFGVHWVIYANTIPGEYLLTAEPLWVDGFSNRRIRGAIEPDRSIVRIHVTDDAQAL